MASITRATLRETIRFLGDFQNVRKFSDASLNTEIQRGFEKFWFLVDSVHKGWWDKEDTVTTVANQAYIALPSDCWRVHGVDVQQSASGDYITLRKVSPSQRNRYGNSTGMPIMYWPSSRGIEMRPVPDAAYTLRAVYTPTAPTLDDVTVREWYTGWEEYVIAYVKLELLRREKMPLGDVERELGAAEAAVRMSADDQNDQEPEYLNLREVDTLDIFDDGLY